MGILSYTAKCVTFDLYNAMRYHCGMTTSTLPHSNAIYAPTLHKAAGCRLIWSYPATTGRRALSTPTQPCCGWITAVWHGRHAATNLALLPTASYRRNNYSLQFYRKGASDYALAFLVFVESEIGQTVAEDGGFEVVQQPPLTDERLDDVLGDDFEERVLINMPIDYIHVATQDTGRIDQFEGDIIYGDQSIAVAHP